MTLQPASWPWLLRHELRLAWRNVGGARRGVLIGLGGLLWLGFHAAAWGLLRLADKVGELSPGVTLIGGAVMWLIFTLMLSQAILLSIGAFFDRGDLDLVLSSPVPPRNVFIVRGLGIAVSSVAIYAALLTPFAHVGLFTGKLSLLAIYPALAGLALLAAAIGMGLTIVLVRALGARRARTVAQLLGAFVGAAFFLTMQLGNLVSHQQTGRWFSAVVRNASDDGVLGSTSPLWLPFDAMLGQPIALFVVVALGAVSFMLIVTSMARRFLDGTQEAVGSNVTPMVETALEPARFRGPLTRAVLVKEWKLIGRDPQLIANTLLQVLYLLPLVFVWARQTSATTVILPALVMAAATLAAGLAWLTVAAEDAPSLLASAPVDVGLLLRAKLVAAVLPVWALMAPVALALLALRPAEAMALVVGVAGATVAVSTIQIALPQRGSRRDMRRRAKGNALASVMELTTTAGWTAMTWCLLAAPLFALLAAVPAIATPAVAWVIGAGRRRAFLDG